MSTTSSAPHHHTTKEADTEPMEDLKLVNLADAIIKDLKRASEPDSVVSFYANKLAEIEKDAPQTFQRIQDVLDKKEGQEA